MKIETCTYLPCLLNDNCANCEYVHIKIDCLINFFTGTWIKKIGPKTGYWDVWGQEKDVGKNLYEGFREAQQ